MVLIRIGFLVVVLLLGGMLRVFRVVCIKRDDKIWFLFVYSLERVGLPRASHLPVVPLSGVLLVLLLPRHLVKVDYTGLIRPLRNPWLIQPWATVVIAFDRSSILTRPGSTTRLPKALDRLYVRLSPTIVFVSITVMKIIPQFTSVPALNRHLKVPALQRS